MTTTEEVQNHTPTLQGGEEEETAMHENKNHLKSPPTRMISSLSAPGVDEAEADHTVDDAEPRHPYVFWHMTVFPWPYLVVFPIILIFLIGFGWSQDDIIEDEVNNIWIPQSGEYAQDKKYAKELGQDSLGSSSFAAMAIARDGQNLFTASRLEEIRARMERAESVSVTYNGIEYTWADLCSNAVGFPYEFPCARFSPMDLFQEARWFMNYTGPDSYNSANPYVPASKQDLYRRTWYHELIGKKLIRPRMGRFGILSQVCALQCIQVVKYRTDPNSPGYSPFSLFADIGNLGMENQCRICIETNYESTIRDLTKAIVPSFQILTAELQRYVQSNNNTNAYGNAVAAVLIAKTNQLANTIDENDVEEFYYYYVTRNVYALLGANTILSAYELLQDGIAQCQQGAGFFNLTCPNPNVTQATAQQMLRNHVDNVFSSVSTAGSPFPFWSHGNGTGELFKGNSPIGGSGINMSGTMESLFTYLDITKYGQDGWSPLYGSNGYADPTSPLWQVNVEVNPLYAWFMASVTDAEPGMACGNGLLPGLKTGVASVDDGSMALVHRATQFWCTKYSIPNTNNTGDGGPYTKLHFAKMWFDLLIHSDAFLGIIEGVHDPYTWTLGQGCGYTLKGQRDPYTNRTESSILYNASRDLYFIDEGEVVGVLSPALLMGDVEPPIGEYSFENPLEKVGVVQTLYAAALPKDIVQRVKHCKRPGGPVNISLIDAEEILYQWKETMEHAWTEGWNDEDEGEVQFVAFFDDSAVVGTTGRMLKEITLDNNTLTAIAICLIAFFSVLFLASANWIESRVLITLIGTGLVVLAFFGALGFSLLLGIKISVTIAWTLPFVMLGLGVDDMYIILFALKKQRGYTKFHFLKAMKEVIVPVTMTSVVNLSMFAILNTSDIPAIYLTSQVAVYSVISLYLVIITCFPAWCYLDMRRQHAGNMDIFFWSKSNQGKTESSRQDIRQKLLYDDFYRPLMLGSLKVRRISHTIVWMVAAGIFAAGCYGITQRDIGLGLEDFFPAGEQSSVWAHKRTETLASWSIGMNWGKNDYTDPHIQMKIIKQFEDVVDTDFVADVDTNQLWLSNLLLWSSRHCTDNFAREDFNVRKCGLDVILPDGTACSANWTANKLNLHTQNFKDVDEDQCEPFSGGICRPLSRMHPGDIENLQNKTALADTTEFCPVISDWSEEKWKFCLVQWRNLTGTTAGRLNVVEDHGSLTDCSGEYNNDQNVTWPIPFTNGPLLFAAGLYSHQDTLELMEQTRAICDYDDDVHCWMSGIPYDYWSQYENIFEVLLQLSGLSLSVGFIIALVFLFGKFYFEKRHSLSRIVLGSLFGALLIVVTMVLSLVAVVGISILCGVRLTGFSNMSFVLSVGFAVEYSVHIVARFLRADTAHKTGLDRVKYTMSFLMMPTFMSFVSSTIGVICLAFTEFEFNQVFFFRPLMIVMAVTYFYGCWWLPALLSLVDSDSLKLGKEVPVVSESAVPMASAQEDSDPSNSDVNMKEEEYSSPRLEDDGIAASGVRVSDTANPEEESNRESVAETPSA